MLHQQIQEEIKSAMKEKNEVKLRTIRDLLTSFTNELVATGRKPQEKLNDDEAIDVIRRASKRRKDSIEQFTAGNRDDLARSEKEELEIIESYLPQMMSEDDIRKFITAKKEEINDPEKTKGGMFIGTIMKELKGKADGSLVKKIVEETP